MGRPRKVVEQAEKHRPDEWKLYFSAAFGGLVARGGLSEDQMIKTAAQYADSIIKHLSENH